jgi:hypothetical protein
MQLRARLLPAMAILSLGLATPSCRFLDQLWDRTESCHDTKIVLTNDEQTLSDVFIIGPDEPVVEELRLASGKSREITLCVEIGHNYRFRVFRDGTLLVASHCPASRRQYENTKPEVRWTPAGLLCVGW